MLSLFKNMNKCERPDFLEDNSIKHPDFIAPGKSEDVNKVLSSFECIKSKRIWKIFDDIDKWVLYTDPVEHEANITPYYCLSKDTFELRAMCEPMDNSYYCRLYNNIIYLPNDSEGNEWLRAIIYIITEGYVRELKTVCSAVFKVSTDSFTNTLDTSDETRLKQKGSFMKGFMDAGDIVYLMTYDGTLCGKAIINKVESESEEESSVSFSIIDACDELNILFYLKVDRDNENILRQLSRDILKFNYVDN